MTINVDYSSAESIENNYRASNSLHIRNQYWGHNLFVVHTVQDYTAWVEELFGSTHLPGLYFWSQNIFGHNNLFVELWLITRY